MSSFVTSFVARHSLRPRYHSHLGHSSGAVLGCGKLRFLFDVRRDLLVDWIDLFTYFDIILNFLVVFNLFFFYILVVGLFLELITYVVLVWRY